MATDDHTPETLKRCTKCGDSKPLASFPKRKRSTDGRSSHCKACCLLRKISWRARNPEKNKDGGRRIYWANPEKHRAKQRRFMNTPEKREKSRAAGKAYYHSHKEESKARARKWTAKNRDKVRDRTRRAEMKRAQVPGAHTTAQWRILCDQFGGRCVRCGVSGRMTRDHVVPVSYPGSNDDISNIQPLCHSCNASKNNLSSVDYRETPFTGQGKTAPIPEGVFPKKSRAHTTNRRRGTANPASKVTPEQVQEIRRLYREGMNCAAISRLFPISHSCTWRIARGDNWK